jgi:DNA-binding response OmpR family regulator
MPESGYDPADMHTVLIADDDPDIHELLLEFLDPEKIRALSAFSGEEVMSMVESEKPDLILLDSVMPRSTGGEVLADLQPFKAKRGFYIVVFTARDDQQSRAHALEIGADDYVTKPASMRKLMAKIDGFLARRP